MPSAKHLEERESVTAELEQNPGYGLGIQIPLAQQALDWIAELHGARAPAAASGESMPALEENDRESVQEEPQQVEGTLFEQGGSDRDEVAMNDVRQGRLGDCYFLAVLASIARVRPDFIENMMQDNGDGTYTVTFQTEQGVSGVFGGRSGQQVTVDSQFWLRDGGAPAYAGTGDRGSDGPELWVMVIEKAWAKLHGGYAEITGGNVSDDAREAVTGEEADYLEPTDLTEEELLGRLNRHFNENNLPVIFWSHGEEKEKKLTENGVVGNHEYALRRVDAEAGTVRLYNPWGYDHITDVDMAFLQANFQRIRFLDLPSSS